MKATVVIKDLPEPTDLERKETALTPERMKRIVGGSSAVTVDGVRTRAVDDVAGRSAMFEGRVKGR
ncbi:hypothetical protein ACFQ3P_21500 [Paraburkholderia sabiae]|jgi:hypothetical protein|uniref:Uncharacterized protein n=1 Tax=Paraburkholderia sabiae TaxID=273251 RepID=A0ABU9QBK5_9BURK|nr:hypothetical protein [Paraburkholderia sabiae]WJZ76966.1 hypothetical protein QEN71_14585 [Paraburkholderia sabiae]CAD6543219.1 hypothetical protein LMG24235_03886 [Paraburkholderia sabiae]